MKNKLTLLLAAALLAVTFTRAADLATIPAGASDLVHREPVDVVALTKERDEAKAAASAAQTQLQQNSIVTEYYKAVAEKNEAILRLVAVQQQLEAANKELAETKAKLETLSAAGAKAAALADKIAPQGTKK